MVLLVLLVLLSSIGSGNFHLSHNEEVRTPSTAFMKTQRGITTYLVLHVTAYSSNTMVTHV